MHPPLPPFVAQWREGSLRSGGEPGVARAPPRAPVGRDDPTQDRLWPTTPNRLTQRPEEHRFTCFTIVFLHDYTSSISFFGLFLTWKMSLSLPGHLPHLPHGSGRRFRLTANRFRWDFLDKPFSDMASIVTGGASLVTPGHYYTL